MAFFKVRKPKRFEYVPRIWDPDRDEREAREAQIRKQLGIVDTDSADKAYIPDLRGSFRREYERVKGKSLSKPAGLFQFGRASWISVVIVGLLLVMFFYFIKIYPYMFSPAQQTDSVQTGDIYE
jgi:hypothetical protein